MYVGNYTAGVSCSPSNTTGGLLTCTLPPYSAGKNPQFGYCISHTRGKSEANIRISVVGGTPSGLTYMQGDMDSCALGEMTMPSNCSPPNPGGVCIQIDGLQVDITDNKR